MNEAANVGVIKIIVNSVGVAEHATVSMLPFASISFAARGGGDSQHLVDWRRIYFAGEFMTSTDVIVLRKRDLLTFDISRPKAPVVVQQPSPLASQPFVMTTFGWWRVVADVALSAMAPAASYPQKFAEAFAGSLARRMVVVPALLALIATGYRSTPRGASDSEHLGVTAPSLLKAVRHRSGASLSERVDACTRIKEVCERLQSQKVYVVIASAIVALAFLPACGSDRVVVAIPLIAAEPTLLVPSNANDGVVVGEMLQLDCGNGLEPILLPAFRRAAVVGDTGVRYTSMKSSASGVTYEFTEALPGVEAVIVTFLKKPGSVVVGFESENPTALDFRAAWPHLARDEPAKLLVQSLSFTDMQVTVGGITLCVA